MINVKVGTGLGLLALLLVAGCSAPGPTEEQARRSLARVIDKGDESHLKLVAFEKTDGLAQTRDGVNRYAYYFTARAEFVSNALYRGEGLNIKEEFGGVTTEPDERQFQFLLGSSGYKRARKGDTLILRGATNFERRESGWVAGGPRMSLTPSGAP